VSEDYEITPQRWLPVILAVLVAGLAVGWCDMGYTAASLRG
jgi:hypothetical protein